MRVALGVVMLVGLASCQSHHGIVVLVENGNPNVRAIRLYVGTGDSMTSSLTPSSKVQVDDAEYWVRDPGNASDVVTVDGQSELRFVFDTDAGIPVAIAVGYDQDQLPIAAGLVHDLAPVDGSDFAGYELTLTSPIAPLGAQGQPMQIALWSPDATTSQFDAACAGVVVAGEDHPYFVVAENDQDCDGLLDDAKLECNPDVYLGMRPADPAEATCLVASIGPAEDNDCQLGGEPCTDGVPRGMGACVAGHTCVPFDVCTLCTGSDAVKCAADLQTAGVDLATLPHYECPLHAQANGEACGETLVLDRPPTGGYDCTDFQIGDAHSPLGTKLQVGELELAATLHTGSGTSCAAELAPNGSLGADPSFTALVSFTLKNKAGVAIPIHFTTSATPCASADVACTLVGPAFSDPEFTECAAQWSAPTLVSTLTTTTGNASDPTLTSDQLTIYYVSGDKLYTAHRAVANDPWGMPAMVAFNGLATDAIIRLPKVSGDGTKMFLEIIDNSGTVDRLFYATQNSSPTDWSTPVPLIYIGPLPLTLTSATFGPGNLVIVGAHGDVGGGDLFEGPFDETTKKIATLTPLGLDTQANEDAPALSLDGLELYFQSDLSGVVAPYVASRRNLSETFSTATRLEELEGAGLVDGAPWVANGARTMYLASNRLNGTTRIFMTTRTTF